MGFAGTEWEAKCLQMRTPELGVESKVWRMEAGPGPGGSGLQDWKLSTTSAEVLLAFYKEMLIKD